MSVIKYDFVYTPLIQSVRLPIFLGAYSPVFYIDLNNNVRIITLLAAD